MSMNELEKTLAHKPKPTSETTKKAILFLRGLDSEHAHKFTLDNYIEADALTAHYRSIAYRYNVPAKVSKRDNVVYVWKPRAYEC